MIQTDLLATFALLSAIPFLLVCTTCFIKVSVVLGFLKRGLSLSHALPASVLTALSVLLSIFIMLPVLSETYDIAQPILTRPTTPTPTPDDTPNPTSTSPNLNATLDALSIDDLKALTKPLHTWVQRHASPAYHTALLQHANDAQRPSAQPLTRDHPVPLLTAFVLTELQEAFIIGFLILLPFLVLELLIALMVSSLQMTTLQPSTVSLPFKLLLFVLIDGWSLITQGLILNYTQAPPIP